MEWDNDSEERQPWEFNDTDRPPILRGKACPKCGSDELILEHHEPVWWRKLIGEQDCLVVMCCICSWRGAIAPMDRKGV